MKSSLFRVENLDPPNSNHSAILLPPPSSLTYSFFTTFPPLPPSLFHLLFQILFHPSFLSHYFVSNSPSFFLPCPSLPTFNICPFVSHFPNLTPVYFSFVWLYPSYPLRALLFNFLDASG